jgi:hypothetical protein
MGRTVATLAVMLCACSAAAQPRPETEHAFEQYAAAVEARIERDRGTSRFLRLAGDPRGRARLRGGEVPAVAAKSLGVQPSIAIPGGQVQHWVGAGFIPGMNIARTLQKLQDYNNRKRDMAPAIVESRILSREGDQFRVWLRMQQRDLIAAVFDLIVRITYRPRESGQLEIESRTESIQEVPGLDAPRGAAARDRGLLWALDDYWRFAEQDGGVYAECEALVLARQTPVLLRWIADPLVARTSRRTLDGILEATIRMVQRER